MRLRKGHTCKMVYLVFAWKCQFECAWEGNRTERQRGGIYCWQGSPFKIRSENNLPQTYYWLLPPAPILLLSRSIGLRSSCERPKLSWLGNWLELRSSHSQTFGNITPNDHHLHYHNITNTSLIYSAKRGILTLSRARHRILLICASSYNRLIKYPAPAIIERALEADQTRTHD